MPKPDLSFAFNLKPEKAIAYFKSKGYAFSWDWHDIWQEAHAKAFTVAKAMRMDILQDIRGALQKSLDEGQNFRAFKKALEPRLKAKGWWGKKMVGDEQGAARVQLGSPWRLKTIYRNNMQTAFMAGRYKGMMDVADRRPFWQYIAVLDLNTRLTHKALHGKIFRHDDPFWNTHYPPNDWGCRCRVKSVSKREFKRDKLTAESSKGKLSTAEELVSKKTGELTNVTVYTDPLTGMKISPGAGWNYNPGKAAWQPNLKKYDPDIRKLWKDATE